jgi:hypothetical protein
MPYKTRLSDDVLGDLIERQGKSTTTELDPSIKVLSSVFKCLCETVVLIICSLDVLLSVFSDIGWKSF